ncbi:nucleoside-diphosphate sugar epimerase/dehydratase [Rheinheimera sp. 1928-s]|uniref:polysaccharide biosynthesis protein n=1 Tax=Rheinheimera sp. 1928-s TaxID=3033803 RepID=UPI0026282F80|nr:nucleoside-diphosphate sugar epimerase/dehydratase [Rheinheimera sp. 1928-s]MDF3125749.1 nucleoside-diphosphate sugar epimerase/dehydratase [Rheinheimera sp. 1928-s]
MGFVLNKLSSKMLYQLFKPLMGMSRNAKRLVSMLVDGCILFLAWLSAYFLRFDHLGVLSDEPFLLSFLAVIFITLVVFGSLGLYRAVVRYIGLRSMLAIAVGTIISGFLLRLVTDANAILYSASVNLNYIFFAFVGIGGSRLLLREIVSVGGRHAHHKVLIYGAGASGRQLLLALASSAEYRAVAFVDDDPSFHGVMIKDVKVYSPVCIKSVVDKYGISRILLAVPSASRTVRAELVQRLEPLGLPVLTIPGMTDLVDGKMKIDELQDVKIEDLLGRDAVTPIPSLLTANITGKVVMVTGAGGSIGSELCRQIILQSPLKLVLFEASEFSLYEIDKELSATIASSQLDVQLIPALGTVLDPQRLQTMMQGYHVQTVYHAAAYKHVPLVEFNVIEGLRNNVFGTWHTAEAAIASGVETFVLISTDKAVRPTNVMGTTKRLAELTLQAIAKRQKNTRICMVRFGNVLGSSGSVVPLFRKQIKKGGPITLTHEDITRYFMTIPEAAQLVIQAGAMGEGGDVFVLDMGEPVKIYDLARKMVHLTGLEVKNKQNPQGDIEIKITGLRPGEKLYEELLIGEDEKPTRHPRIKAANEVFLSWAEMQALLSELSEAAINYDVEKIRALMLSAPTGFNPTDGICDLVWQAHQITKLPIR